jgi:hypothetical protein
VIAGQLLPDLIILENMCTESTDALDLDVLKIQMTVPQLSPI